MSVKPSDGTLSLDAASAAWDLLSAKVEALNARWRASPAPPLADLLHADPPALRRLVLIELIKTDLQHRWQSDGPRKRLEDYSADFAELVDVDGYPFDLIYEEFFVRKQSGEPVTPQEYADRFPSQADELRRNLREDDVHVTTALFSGESIEELDIDQRIDDFDLLARLGKGAFASVFLARQRSLGRLVALKVSADRGFETQTLSQLDHPHIVRVFDQRLLPERRMRLMYMQYVAGGTLQAVVDRARRTLPSERSGRLLLTVLDEALAERGESPPHDSRARHRLARVDWSAAACWIGARLASALDYAHSQGVLHRDLKPANVLMAADGGPKLADFNISFSSSVAGATAAAYFGGSLAYMSPEQLEACNPAHERRPEELDGRSDIYSLGIVLWELLTGHRPFHDEKLVGFNPQALARMIEQRRAGPEPLAIEQLRAVCPTGLVEVLLTCLAAEPADRFATAGQLERQLELCLQPEVQRMLRPRGSMWLRWSRRHPLLAMVGIGVIPNAIFSALSISYNQSELIRVPDAAQAALRQGVFDLQVVVVNPLFYSIAISVLLAVAWPVYRVVQRRARGITEVGSTDAAKRRCPWLGDYTAWVSGAGWAISGLVFPLWLRMAGARLVGQELLHFFASQLLCGLMAATLTYFWISALELRSYSPLLLDGEPNDATLGERLIALAHRAPYYGWLAYSVPAMAMVAFSVVHTRSQIAFGVLGAVGLICSMLAFRMSRQIQRDAAALEIAANPMAPTILGTDSSDSFWTASR